MRAITSEEMIKVNGGVYRYRCTRCNQIFRWRVFAELHCTIRHHGFSVPIERIKK